MRRSLLTAAVVGVLGLSGAAVAGPALAAVGAPDAAAGVTSRVDRVKEALSGLVGDGTLTQEQADEVATTLDRAPGLRGPGPDGHRGRGPHGGAGRLGPDLAAAATALGVTEDDLRAALRDGRSLAQVAQERGVAVDAVVAALVEAGRARLAEAVSAGRLTQEQADARAARLEERFRSLVDRARAGRGPGRAVPGAVPD